MTIPFTIDGKTAMLAKAGAPELIRDAVMEAKLDGHRFIATIEAEGRVRMFARSGVDKSGKCPNIEDALHYLPPGTVLDGEIVSLSQEGGHWGSVQTVMGASSKVTDKLTYVVFDILAFDGADIRNHPLRERRQLLEGIFLAFSSLRGCVQLIQQTPYTPEAVNDLMANGWEGAIIKDPAGRYQSGKRAQIKVKAVDTLDVVVMGATDGKGALEGLVGALIFGQYTERPYGATPGAHPTLVALGKCSGMTMAQRREFTMQHKRGELVGTVIEVQHMGVMETGGWRHPQFKRLRIDKAPEECVA